jgi:hypothetical protein
MRACARKKVRTIGRRIRAREKERETSPALDGLQFPDGQEFRALYQSSWSLGFDSQGRGTRENRRTLYSSTGFLKGSHPHVHSLVLGPSEINTHER